VRYILGLACEFSYNRPLNSEYTRFTSIIGLDDEVIGGAVTGSVVYRVILDNVEEFSPPPMSPGLVKFVDLDVTGKNTMKLVTEQSATQDYGHTDWGNAVLTKNLFIIKT